MPRIYAVHHVNMGTLEPGDLTQWEVLQKLPLRSLLVELPQLLEQISAQPGPTSTHQEQRGQRAHAKTARQRSSAR